MSRLTEHDKEIQELLERGLQPENSQDSKDLNAYQALFDALKKKPVDGLPFNFASKVVSEIRMQQSLQFDFRGRIIFLVFLVVIICAFYLGVSAIDRNTASLVFHFALSNKWIACFSICCYLLVEYLNYRLIKK